MEIIDAAGRYADPGQAGAGYVEHLRRPDLSLALLVFFGPAEGSRDGAAEPGEMP